METFPKAAWDLLETSVVPYKKIQSQQVQRLLSNEELLHVRRKLHDQDWDNGLIEQFMDEKDTNAYSIQINNDRKVNIFTKDTHSQSINRTASEVDRILSWLGAPQKFTVNLWLIDKPRSIDAHEWPSRTSVNGGWATGSTATRTCA